MQQPTLGILIGGSSHVGKSTLAKRLAYVLNRKIISTDDLARHPGRPWPSLRPQVAEFYSSLSDDTIHWFLKIHHENMWPRICHTVERCHMDSIPFILEGAALRPEYVMSLDPNIVSMVFLYADDDFLRSRMMDSADYSKATRSIIPIIDKFIERSIRENREMLEAARATHIPCFDVANPKVLDAFLRNFEPN